MWYNVFFNKNAFLGQDTSSKMPKQISKTLIVRI